MTAESHEPQRAMSKHEIDELFSGGQLDAMGSAGEAGAGGAAVEEPSDSGRGGSFAAQGGDEAESTPIQPVEFGQLQGQDAGGKPQNILLLLDVKLPVAVELGRNRLPVREILEFGPGSIVELDRAASEPVDLLVNGVLVAHGEVVVIEDHFGVRLTTLISPEERIRSLARTEG
jgi:flagellar motor switch protein FliN